MFKTHHCQPGSVHRKVNADARSGRQMSVSRLNPGSVVMMRGDPAVSNRLRTSVSVLVLLSFSFTAACIQRGTLAAESIPSQPVLHLVNGSFLPGQLLGSDQPGRIRWKSRLFTQPFDFPLSGVVAVQFPVVQPRPAPTGVYCVELSGGDVLYGDIVELSDTLMTLRASNVGIVHIQRSSVHRIYRRKETSLLYLGPDGLNGWNVAVPGIPSGEVWIEDGGWPRTELANASLFRDFGMPARCSIEFELSWDEMPDFEFVLGPGNLRGVVDAAEQVIASRPIDDAFRFEVWDRELVVVGESERDADVASVTPIASGPGAVRVQLYLDQEKQRLSVYSRTGSQIASVRLHSMNPEVRGGVRLTNRRGDIQLKHLRIAHWDGILPQDVEADQSRVHQIDGTIVYGQVTAFDLLTEKFTLTRGGKRTLVDAAMISDVFLSPVTEEPDLADSEANAGGPGVGADMSTDRAGLVRITCQNGATISGRFVGIRNGQVILDSRSIDEQMMLALHGIRSISRQSPVASAREVVVQGRSGRLELEGTKLLGRLIDGRELAEASCLVWHPDLSLTASPLAKGPSGRIVYRELPRSASEPDDSAADRHVEPQRGNQEPAVQQGFGDVFKQMLTGKIAPRQKPEFRAPQTLHLRSGDTIPCKILSVDEAGLHFTTPLSNATFVANQRVKGLELHGLELHGRPVARTLDETKRKRLLTLPRLQKNSPPTHLLCSTNDDFLRGRLVAMNEETLTVEVRLTNQEIPRDRVAQIIWLHTDELQSADTSESTEGREADANDASAGESGRRGHQPPVTEFTRVQTVVRHKDRLTFNATRVDGATVSGNSDILGECQSQLAEIDQLLLGTYIEQDVAQLACQRWKLHYAAEPKFVLAGEDGSDGRPPDGTQSPLVGQPAPDFRLQDLAGNTFHLAEHRGEVIVLDFWATWCSPCLKTMPLVDEVVKNFSDSGVRLLAVNMEEQPTAIRSTLELHHLNAPVILDRDAVVAARYAVTSIPQTVVIDRDGNVARLFVGGGPKLVEPLRKSLQELTGMLPDVASSHDANPE